MSKPVVFFVVVVRVDSLAALKSISNSPSPHKITLYTASSPSILPIFCVAALPGSEIEFALLAVLAYHQAAGFLAHFERFSKSVCSFLRGEPLNDTGAGGVLLHFFEVQAVDHFFGDAHEDL